MSLYSEEAKAYLPRQLKSAWLEAVAQDGRSESEILRSLIVDWVNKKRRHARSTARSTVRRVIG